MLIYIWSIPLTLISAIICAYLSKQNNTHGGWWSFVMYMSPLIIPAWLVISKHSKNLIIDGIIYDITLFIGYTVAIIILCKDDIQLSLAHIIGLLLAITGIILMKS